MILICQRVLNNSYSFTVKSIEISFAIIDNLLFLDTSFANKGIFGGTALKQGKMIVIS